MLEAPWSTLGMWPFLWVIIGSIILGIFKVGFLIDFSRAVRSMGLSSHSRLTNTSGQEIGTGEEGEAYIGRPDDTQCERAAFTLIRVQKFYFFLAFPSMMSA